MDGLTYKIMNETSYTSNPAGNERSEFDFGEEA